MKMTSHHLDDPISCDVCGATHPKKIDAGRVGWDWFTGYLKEIFHCCPNCVNSKAYMDRYYASQRKEQGQ